jgi:hypothetical protein
VPLRLFAVVGATIILGWPAPEAAERAAVPASAGDVLYFAIVDRFADGDPGNNVAVDRSARGAFHGGDLKGLRAHLDEIADLGVTALWITPVVHDPPSRSRSSRQTKSSGRPSCNGDDSSRPSTKRLILRFTAMRSEPSSSSPRSRTPLGSSGMG